jgi:hypothetical protein
LRGKHDEQVWKIMVDNNGDNKPSVLTISSNKLGIKDSVNRAKWRVRAKPLWWR